MFNAERLFAELRDAHLDNDAILLAAEACRGYIMRCGKRHPEGLRVCDLSNACARYVGGLNVREWQRVQVLLVKMPQLASRVCPARRGNRHTLRFWRADCAPSDAFCMGKREVAYA